LFWCPQDLSLPIPEKFLPANVKSALEFPTKEYWAKLKNKKGNRNKKKGRNRNKNREQEQEQEQKQKQKQEQEQEVEVQVASYENFVDAQVSKAEKVVAEDLQEKEKPKSHEEDYQSVTLLLPLFSSSRFHSCPVVFYALLCLFLFFFVYLVRFG